MTDLLASFINACAQQSVDGQPMEGDPCDYCGGGICCGMCEPDGKHYECRCADPEPRNLD